MSQKINNNLLNIIVEWKGKLYMIVFKLFFIVMMSFFLIKLIRKKSFEWGFTDTPNGRSMHSDTMPKGAGIGFILSLYIGMYLFAWPLVWEHWYILLALFMVFAVGILDDHQDAKPKTKFYVISIAVILVWFYGLRIDSLGKWFGYEFELGWFALPFSLFAIVGFTNALNLIDGQDGLAASVSIVILLVWAMIGYDYGDRFMVFFAIFTIAAMVGFLYYNWHPASIFMGDSGSLSLGFIISVLAIMGLDYIHPVTVLYIAAIPILDTLIVFIRRIRQDKSPFIADKTHLHHILYQFFDESQMKTVVFLVLMQVVFSSSGYMLTLFMKEAGHQGIAPASLSVFVIIILLSYMVFSSILERQKLVDKQRKYDQEKSLKKMKKIV